MYKRMTLLLVAVVLMALALAACTQTVEKVVEVTVEKQVVVTQVVEKEGEKVVEQVVVTATPEPAKPVTFVTDDPTTYTWLTFGDIDTMDPNLAYDTASFELIDNVMEGLIEYNRQDATSYVPALAMEVPSIENGGISADGLTYTFQIRPGVKYQDGNDLTASDAAYTFQRGLIQSDPNSAQWLFLEPVLGFGSCYDITEAIDPECGLAGDRDTLLATATPEQLVAACELVQKAVVADDAAGTLTFNLAQPWGPFLATLAGGWGSIIDKEWAVANGAWDGSCTTWQNYYAPGSENDELTDKINGTGPYTLQQWTPGEGYTLVANENYWRADADVMWDGGPSGAARIKTVNVKLVDEWGTRFAALQAGDADNVTVPIENRPQVDQLVGEECDYATETCTPTDNPNGPLRAWRDLPNPSRTDAFMVFNIPPDSPYIGSGQLDGNGIPPDFFSDIHVRKAMNYCFDYDIYIQEALNGDGVRNNGPIILDMLGYNPDGEMYPFDIDKCAEELALAWEGKLPEIGFRFQVAFNTGNTARQTVGEILQANLEQINPLYQVETVGLPWPTFLRSIRASQLPIFVSGWIEDIHDPHNWVQPFTVGTYAGRQVLPQDILDQFQALVSAGVQAADPAEREKIYFELQQLHHDLAIQVTLAQATGVRYEQRWVKDFYYNPIGSLLFYTLSLDGGQ